MSNATESMLGILPPIVLGGAMLMFTERFIQRPEEQRRRRRPKPLDRQQYKDNKRGPGFGDFSNIGY